MGKKSLIFCVVAVCATFIACSLILVKPNLLFRKVSGISVKGFASEQVFSDVASWGCTISARSSNLQEGAQEACSKVRCDCQTAAAFFEAAGAVKGEMEIGAVTVSEIRKKNENGYDTNTVEGYSASAFVSVASRDIKTVEKLFKRSGELVEKGVNIWATAPQYFYTKIESLKLDLIGKATENARERALRLTQAGGSKLGGIISASQGVFQITQPLSTETSSYGVYETGTIEKEVKCIVNVEFAIER